VLPKATQTTWRRTCTRSNDEQRRPGPRRRVHRAGRRRKNPDGYDDQSRVGSGRGALSAGSCRAGARVQGTPTQRCALFQLPGDVE
jgi:hypothetical protein